MAIPTGDEIHVLAQQKLRADDEIFQQLIERMADMDVAIGIGRAIMKNEGRGACFFSRCLDGLIQVGVAPFGDDFGLELRQAAAHRKISYRQKYGVTVIGEGFGFGFCAHAQALSDAGLIWLDPNWLRRRPGRVPLA